MTLKPKYHANFGDYKIDTGSYTALNWKIPESRDAWAEHFQRMSEAKSEAEWRSVMDDETNRKAAIIHINNSNREKWLKRIGEHDLYYRDIRYSEPYGGFAHEFSPTEKSNPQRITYSVISENSDIVDEMEEAENEMQGHERHDKVGELLGFPECCRNFFLEDWIDASIRDPMYEISCNTPSAEAVDGNHNHVVVKEPNDGTNIMWRYFGLSFLTHMPCSWECERSVDLARRRFRIMSENGYGDAADLIHQWISQPHTWSGLHGQAVVQNSHATSKVNSSCYLSEKKVVWKDDYEVLER